MPELPEVETVVSGLAGKITGRVFKGAEVRASRMVSKGLGILIRNKKIRRVYRRAKLIVMELSSGESLIAHLKMTGQLIFVDRLGKAVGGGHPIKGLALAEDNRFTRIILDFKGRGRLLFHDVRKFGWLKLVSREELDKIFAKHGVEPLSREFTLKKFKAILQRRPRMRIKQLLMSQELIAGIGNIYADESLFASKVRPERKVGSLKQAEIPKLHRAVIRILKRAIELKGTSVNTFVGADGRRGNFAEKLRVYGRGGLNCFRCKSFLKKIRLGGRGTVYCPGCQK